MLLPTAGTVTAVNTDLDSAPNALEDDTYRSGGIVEVVLNDPAAYDDLLTPLRMAREARS
ncbi:hypothetical protein ACIRD3_12590 [Kitasatospora sp. NPDC093550]|uniref:hypothetical protein n=1 Tax=Kitasatospora sp. NPDC093550 TaxID=3364089 RepID=UPI0037F64CBF